MSQDPQDGPAAPQNAVQGLSVPLEVRGRIALNEITTGATMHQIVVPDDVDLVVLASIRMAKAVGSLAPSEGVGRAVSLTVLPGQVPGQFVPALVFALTLPSAALGQQISGTALSMDLWLSEAQIESLVRDLLESLRAERSRQLSEAFQGQPTG